MRLGGCNSIPPTNINMHKLFFDPIPHNPDNYHVRDKFNFVLGKLTFINKRWMITPYHGPYAHRQFGNLYRSKRLAVESLKRHVKGDFV